MQKFRINAKNVGYCVERKRLFGWKPLRYVECISHDHPELPHTTSLYIFDSIEDARVHIYENYESPLTITEKK